MSAKTNSLIILVILVIIIMLSSLQAGQAGSAPNPYVKVYLLPDPSKETKRKTKIAKSTFHPTFNEMVSNDKAPLSFRDAGFRKTRLFCSCRIA